MSDYLIIAGLGTIMGLTLVLPFSVKRVEEELDYGFLEVALDKETGEVVGLLFREGWVTASGLKQGAKPETVIAVYGHLPTRWYPLMRYERRGITFMMSPELTLDAQGKPEGWVAQWAKIYAPRR